jgi:para-nitrobenzyl esterase
MKQGISFLLSIFLFTTTNSHAQTMNNPIVNTANGQIQGIPENDAVIAFKGIPFGQPPVGNLRWKAPVPVKNWEGILKADHFGPSAMQTNIFGDMVYRSKGTNEDCLYLNVWKPSKKSKKPLPVLVYYYGGGFVAGDGSEPRYDGASMAALGIVAVTVNYRLGVFGFLSHPELTKESAQGSSGNYGLMDQALALKWVYENISAFGGDPNKITIAGESAGSVSVSALMASPLSRNYIAGAIGESGSIMGALPALPLREGEKNGIEFVSFMGAKGIDDLRKISADTLLQKALKYGAFRFNRTIDGYFFPKDPKSIFAAGEQSNVPLLAGWNSEESGYKSVMGNAKPNLENYRKAVEKLYGKDAEKVLKAYAPSTDAEVEEVSRDLAGDRFISYSTWKWIEMHRKTGQPVYRYLYEKPRPGNKGAVHSAEIEYAMGNLATNKVFKWTDEDFVVSKTMQAYFANFIKKGDPNGKGLSKWNAIGKAGSSPVMFINVESKQTMEKHPERYALMDEFATRN